MNNIKIGFLFFCCMITSFWLPAQEPTLPTEEVDVIKNFDARLLDTERVPLSPELPPLDTTTKRQNYNVVTKNINVDYLPPKIRPLAMPGDDLPERYRGYAKAGAGLPSSFYGEASYNVLNQDKTLDLGFNLKHHSANNNRSVENQRFGYTHGDIDGTYYFDQGFAVNGKLGYTADQVFFYGYNELNEETDQDISFAKDDVKQVFSIFDIGANIFNGERTAADFNYYAGFDYYLLQDDYATRENGFLLNIGATKWFSDTHPLTVKLVTDFTSYKNNAKQTLNNFFLQPSYTYHGDVFKVKLGANIASTEDEFSFFPDVEATAFIVEGILGAFIGAEGGLIKNSFRNLSDYNPFIESRVDVRNTRYYNYYGGVKGTIQGIDYNAQVGYKTTDDLALFLLSDLNDSIPRFDVIYDTASIFIIKASLSASLFENLLLTGTVSQSVFSPDNQEKAWHLPTLDVNVSGVYAAMEDKLLVKADFFLQNGVPFRNSEGEAENLNALFDISLGAEYFFSEKVGGFIQLNNIANNKRQRWHRYPVLGLNALFGITARF